MRIAACDVSKDYLDLSVDGIVRRIGNDESAIDVFVLELGEAPLVAMESTGPYHEKLAKRASALGASVYVVNARRFCAYKRSEAVRGKTDRLDAQTLELYVREKKDRLHPYQAPKPSIERLRELVVRREAIVSGQTQILQSLQGAKNLGHVRKDLKAALKDALDQLDKQIAEVLKTLETAQLLLQVPGIGPLNAAGLLSLLERYEFASADAFVAYLGLDPRANDSGKRTGKRYISCDGDASVRRLLYVGALAASKTKAWKNYYQKQRDKGLSTTESTLILARKLARAAWSIHKYKTPFNTERIDKQT
jgi:transposase